MTIFDSALRFVSVVAVGTALGLAPCAMAQSFTVEQVMNSPFPSSLTAAAQGSKVAWVFDAKGSRNVWVAEGPGFAAHQVTHYTGDDGLPIAALRLTPDGRQVVYARGSELNRTGQVANPDHDAKQPKQTVFVAIVGGGEPRALGEMECTGEDCEDIEISPDGRWATWPGKHELWIARLDGTGTAKQLTEIRGDVSQPQWSPDGTRIAAEVDRGDHGFTAILDVQDGALTAVHYVAPSVDQDISPRWSPDGTRLAFLRVHGTQSKRALIPWHPEPWSLWVADARTYEGREIWKSGETVRDSLPEFGPDQIFFAAGNRVVFGSEADNRNHLYSISADGGKATLLTPGEFDVEDASMSPDRKTVIYSSNDGDVDRRHIWRVGVVGGATPTSLSKGETMEWKPVETGDGRVVCLGSTAVTPAQVFALAKGGREGIAKETLPAEFPSARLVAPKQVIFPSTDGLMIHGQLFVPKGRVKPGPALIFTHGGPKRQMMLGFHYKAYYHNAYAENEYLASLGYVVLSINYRLGVMYGADFREPANAGWRGASEYDDVLAGAKYLQGLPIVDPNKLGLWGGSYGGYLTAMGLARNSDLFKVGVDFHGVHDWSELLWHQGNIESAPDAVEARKLAFASSPNAAINTWKSPVLLIQGDDDRNVPFSQMVEEVQLLREHQVPFEQIVYPDDIHEFLLWRDWVKSYEAAGDFFQKYLPTK